MLSTENLIETSWMKPTILYLERRVSQNWCNDTNEELDAEWFRKDLDCVGVFNYVCTLLCFL
ncbi:unnamed protein product [Camellia sinensis]